MEGSVPILAIFYNSNERDEISKHFQYTCKFIRSNFTYLNENIMHMMQQRYNIIILIKFKWWKVENWWIETYNKQV